MSVREGGEFRVLPVLQLVFIPPISDLCGLSQAAHERFDGDSLTDTAHQTGQHDAVLCSANVKCGIIYYILFF